MRDKMELVKENVVSQAPIPAWGVWAAAGATLAALAAVSLVELTLPPPRGRHDAAPTSFMADVAYQHLVNLTSIGPRVAGTYENEVAAVSMLVEALRGIAREASAHNHVEIDLHRSSGAFSLTFFDGMNNVYRDVQSVVGRVRGAGGAAAPALLLNCHYDTVPDSPGASDDGAGCAVLLEVMRALAASPSPLRHPVVFLFNGAEENIMQASHAFITTHKWAASVRAFINLEACGAGGREVMFQAGPHDPWIVEVYAGAVPHPFASSLAQELFQSGLIPADTDFRIFRDFGKLSGVDLAWSANGYVYHTRLDVAANVPRAALQRTGDNVLALTHGLLSSERLESAVEPMSRQPVFFDVLGQFVVCVRAPAAFVAALACLAFVALHLHLEAEDARKQLYVSRGWWWRQVLGRAGRAAAGAALGGAAAAAVGGALHAARASLAYYARPWLLAPLYAAPALAVNIYVVTGGGRKPGAVWERGWWGFRAAAGANCLLWALALAGMLAARLRSGFVPALWAALPAAAARLPHPPRAPGWWMVVCWGLGCVLPLLQTWYLALGSLAMFVPITGRAGSQPVPPDVVMAVLVAALSLAASSWLWPLLVSARGAQHLILLLAGACVCACACVVRERGAAAYSPQRPQRVMLFHVQRTLHPRASAPAASAPAASAPAASAPTALVDRHYWMPALDPNTPHSVDHIVPEMKLATETPSWECEKWVYCGGAYFLPVLSLVPRAYRLPAPSAPHPDAEVTVTHHQHWPEDNLMQLQLNITGPSHVVVVVSPAAGARVLWCSALGVPQEARAWGARRTYFVSLHAARRPARAWQLRLHVRLPDGWKKNNEDKEAVQLSVAGHGMGGRRAPEHQRLLDSFPDTVAATGWPVHLHIYSL